MFPLVCEVLFHLCILGTYFWDHFEIMFFCLSPEQKHASWITQCAFHLEMEKRALAVLLKQYCMVVGAWYAWLHPQLLMRTASCMDMFPKSRSKVPLPPSGCRHSCSIAKNVISQKEMKTPQRRLSNSDFPNRWLSSPLLSSSTGTTSHTAAGKWPMEFLKFVFMIWLNFQSPFSPPPKKKKKDPAKSLLIAPQVSKRIICNKNRLHPFLLLNIMKETRAFAVCWKENASFHP